MKKVKPFLLVLCLMATVGCTAIMESRQDYFEWRDSLGLPRQAAPNQQQQQIQQSGQPVYRAQDCIGSIVNGVCHGSTGAAQPQATCHGQMLYGQCTGPLF